MSDHSRLAWYKRAQVKVDSFEEISEDIREQAINVLRLLAFLGMKPRRIVPCAGGEIAIYMYNSVGGKIRIELDEDGIGTLVITADDREKD